MFEILAPGGLALGATYYALNALADRVLPVTVSVQVPNPTDPAHLEDVIAEMRPRGSPTVLAVRALDGWCALEGSHRVTAAAKLGLPITFVEVHPDTLIEGHDAGDMGPNGWTAHDRPVTARSLCTWMQPQVVEVRDTLIRVTRHYGRTATCISKLH